MNWYKSQFEKLASPQVKTIQDRNRINKRINMFKEMAEDKVTSSFPELRNSLLEAVSKARDNYDTVAGLCDVAVEKVYKIVKDMEKERKRFSDKDLPTQMKKFKERKTKNDR